jgi:hypothetical protein
VNLTVERAFLFVGALLALATLFNGLGAFLKRAGVLEPAGYEAYWQLHCGGGETTDLPVALGRRCAKPDLGNPPRIPHREGGRHVFAAKPSEVWLKALKDVFFVTFVLVCAAFVPRFRPARNRALWLSWLAAVVVVAVAGLAAAARGDMLPMMAGLRSFLFLAAAGACGWVASAAALLTLTRWITLVMWAQLPFLSLEVLFGLPINGYLPFLHLPRRMAGTLTLPNSLGVFAVTALVFVEVFAPGRRARWLILVPCILVVLASGSATGVVALLIWAAAASIRAVARERRLAVTAFWLVCAAALLPNLPTVLGRDTVFKGAFGSEGRLGTLLATVEDVDAPRLLFGRGLGAGTNALANLNRNPAVGSGDSAITSLIRQVGLVGTGVLVLFVVLAWRGDRLARPFYEVVCLMSLTLNVTELFPVNFLLGLALGRSIWHTATASSNDERT